MNSQDIAKLANVSTSTVSRVINNYPNVPESTRKKVQAVIDKYGYTPNTSARVLAGKTNNIIGMFVADIDETSSSNKWLAADSPYNSALITNVIKYCKSKGYLVLVDVITDSSECEHISQYFQNRLIYGGIFVGFPYHTMEIEKLAKDHNNVVLIDQLSEEEDKNNNIKLVNSDNVMGGYMATKYLISKGHKNIAFISGDNRLSSIQRQEGYFKALRESNININNELVLNGEYREEVAYKVTQKMIQKNIPSAVFAANDIVALGVKRALEENGLKVPKDVSIIGFDNLEALGWLNLNLTTMEVKIDELAQKAVEVLFKEEIVHEYCKVDLVERDSVKCVNNTK